MFVSRDKSGNFLFSVGCPKRQMSHWTPPDNRYFVANKAYGEELFPFLRWEDEPIEVILEIK